MVTSKSSVSMGKYIYMFTLQGPYHYNGAFIESILWSGIQYVSEFYSSSLKITHDIHNHSANAWGMTYQPNLPS